MQSTPQTHPLAQKFSSAGPEGEIRKAFCTNVLRILSCLKHPGFCAKTSWATHNIRRTTLVAGTEENTDFPDEPLRLFRQMRDLARPKSARPANAGRRPG